MAEKGWRSPGEVWRSYETAHPDPDGAEVRVAPRLTPDEQVAAQVLDARINRAELERMADGAIDRWFADREKAMRGCIAHPLTREAMAELDARYGYDRSSGGRDLV